MEPSSPPITLVIGLTAETLTCPRSTLETLSPVFKQMLSTKRPYSTTLAIPNGDFESLTLLIHGPPDPNPPLILRQQTHSLLRRIISHIKKFNFNGPNPHLTSCSSHLLAQFYDFTTCTYLLEAAFLLRDKPFFNTVYHEILHHHGESFAMLRSGIHSGSSLPRALVSKMEEERAALKWRIVAGVVKDCTQCPASGCAFLLAAVGEMVAMKSVVELSEFLVRLPRREGTRTLGCTYMNVRYLWVVAAHVMTGAESVEFADLVDA